jgi:hypothetical protein
MPPRIQVFVGYARKDGHYLDDFLAHAASLKRNEGVSFFTDRDIPPGADWWPTLQQRIDSANIAVFLLTSNFLASAFCVEEELAQALGNRVAERCVVVPVNVGPFDLSPQHPLRDIQWIPSGKAITEYSGAERQAEWVKVVENLREHISHFSHTTRLPASPDVDRSDHSNVVYGFGRRDRA